MTDLVGAYHPAAGHPAVATAAALADVLARDANEVDRNGVTRDRVDLIARAGLLAPTSPVELGGSAVPEPVAREIVERIAGACGTTWFVVTQHRAPAELAAATKNIVLRDRWAVPLASGTALGAVAFAHLRRPGPPSVRATRVADGWVVDGTLDWVTSWGIADVLLLMAESVDGDVVQALLPMPRANELDAPTAEPVEPWPGVRASGRVPLAAMGGTRTVAVDLAGAHLRDEDVLSVLPKQVWLAQDRLRTVNATPASFGLARAAIGALHVTGERRGSAEALDLASLLAVEAKDLRARAYRLIDDVDAAERTEERVAARAQALDLTGRATSALVAARAGGAVRLDDDAQRYARESMFQLVQAQTSVSRAATLARIAARSGPQPE
jgi:alkylation response protein AidB-like acyl-CoA dehydrogenase